MKRLISCFLILLCVVTALGSCDKLSVPSDEEQIRSCIEAFTEAYNEGDFEAVLDQMTGKQKNALKSMLNIVGLLIGFDASSIFTSLFSLGVAMSEGDYMEVEIQKIEVDSNKATVTALISFNNPYGKEIGISYFHMKKKDDKWLIADITD